MKFYIFSGTTEGKLIWQYLHNFNVETKVFTATPYGAEVMPKEAQKDICVGRLDENDLLDLFRKEQPSAIIDATHPYAQIVSINLKEACRETGIEYLRFLRPKTYHDGVISFENINDAIEYLSENEGNILLTTGSKDLEVFTKIKNYHERVYPRILPVAEGIDKCIKAGYLARNIIAMQGPFSIDLNKAMIDMIKAKFIVTKDTGNAGGFDEKVTAAYMAGAVPVVIKRPENETGYTFIELQKILADKFGLINERIYLKEGISQQSLNISHKFPIFIDLNHKKIIFIGGGKVAERRIKCLQGYGAEITVISPKNTPFIKNQAKCGGIKLIEAEYNEKYLNESYFMAVIATDNKELNIEIGKKTKLMGILTNIVSHATLCNFYFPALISGGGVQGAIISENGENHLLAVNMAEALNKILKKIIY